ncbi:MAG TPA: hypothetical protein PKD86_09265 [Gemmatales bacterium]|nr:hypothetical protein [Gemmatales bacterium]HMP59528.1 hypothetical protein [Gemmatales bacterium]
MLNVEPEERPVKAHTPVVITFDYIFAAYGRDFAFVATPRQVEEGDFLKQYWGVRTGRYFERSLRQASNDRREASVASDSSDSVRIKLAQQRRFIVEWCLLLDLTSLAGRTGSWEYPVTAADNVEGVVKLSLRSGQPTECLATFKGGGAGTLIRIVHHGRKEFGTRTFVASAEWERIAVVFGGDHTITKQKKLDGETLSLINVTVPLSEGDFQHHADTSTPNNAYVTTDESTLECKSPGGESTLLATLTPVGASKRPSFWPVVLLSHLVVFALACGLLFLRRYRNRQR